MKKRLALVEDDDVLRANYRDLLSQAGFEVAAFADKEAALDAFAVALPDVSLVDIALGDERDAGFEICSYLRGRSPRLPIVFLTSHDGDVDRISGLRLGADDYLTKDVSIDYLIVRIETLLRRIAAIAALQSQAHDPQHSSTGPGVAIDEATSRAQWNGEQLDLTLTQFWMLRELLRHPGEVVSHVALMQAARIVVEPNTVTAHIKAIRDAFTRIGAPAECIRAERGRGYRWVPDRSMSVAREGGSEARR
jgi:two-component system OmpR family response regulator